MKGLNIGTSFSYSFLYLLYFFMVILCFTFLPNDKAQANPAEVGNTIKPTPVADNVAVIAVTPIRTTVSTDSKTDVSVL